MNQNGLVQDGGEDPLTALLEAQADRLSGFVARRVGGDARVAEDLAQQTIMQLVAYCDRTGALPPGEEAVRLLFRIAARRILDWKCHVANNRTDLYPSDAALLAEAIISVDPVETVVRRVDVERALARLTASQRRALVLVYVDGLDYQTAAEVMGIGINGLKKHLSRGTARARELADLTGYRKKPASAEGGAQ